MNMLTNNKIWRGAKVGYKLGISPVGVISEFVNSPMLVLRPFIKDKTAYGLHLFTRTVTSSILGAVGGITGGLLGGLFGAFGTALNQTNKAASWVSDFTLPQQQRKSLRQLRNNSLDSFNTERENIRNLPETSNDTTKKSLPVIKTTDNMKHLTAFGKAFGKKISGVFKNSSAESGNNSANQSNSFVSRLKGIFTPSDAPRQGFKRIVSKRHSSVD